jgi:hypothetical protein
MRRKIISWAGVGFFVACAWTLYAFATVPDYEIRMTGIQHFVLICAYITCPVIYTGLRFYWILPLDAVTYALIGIIVERVRRSRPQVHD